MWRVTQIPKPMSRENRVLKVENQAAMRLKRSSYVTSSKSEPSWKASIKSIIRPTGVRGNSAHHFRLTILRQDNHLCTNPRLRTKHCELVLTRHCEGTDRLSLRHLRLPLLNRCQRHICHPQEARFYKGKCTGIRTEYRIEMDTRTKWQCCSSTG